MTISSLEMKFGMNVPGSGDRQFLNGGYMRSILLPVVAMMFRTRPVEQARDSYRQPAACRTCY